MPRTEFHKQLFTVDEVAGRLDVHAKTVRRFIREGRLPAKRIGKEYRITRAALDEFAGTSAAPNQAPIARTRQVLVSSIVDVDAISPEDSQRISTFVMASLNARRGEGAEQGARRGGGSTRRPMRRFRWSKRSRVCFQPIVSSSTFPNK